MWVYKHHRLRHALTSSWTTGKDPPGTNNIFLVNAPEGKPTRSVVSQSDRGGHQGTGPPDQRADLTLSVYDIKRSNLLVQTSEETQATADQNL